ncbi:MAG: hypothetical protein CL843_17335 [Crocinitomicaceae bacterium]|nr:hypothetical protein [Crocinitomicaceae bacterium]|tara:strand:+ start:30115 stop:30756 length:642 start_codon:yes stop_codon:yes gene_type:complete
MDNSTHDDFIIVASTSPLIKLGLQSLMQEHALKGDVRFVQSAEDAKLLIDNQKLTALIVDFDPVEFNMVFMRQVAANLAHQMVVIADENNPSITRQIMQLSIPGILTKTCDEEEIIDCMKATQKGARFYCNKVLDLLLSEQGLIETNCDATVLTPRETEVMALIAEGKTNKEAAEILHLSPHTVHSHRKNIMKKLGVNSVSELVREALQLKII